MDRLVCLGLSHRTAPVELRERLGDARAAARSSCPAVEEHAVLSTCYRVELYAYLSDGVEEAREELIDVLAEGHDVERELLVDHLYVHAGEDVARHLCRVAAGLDSLVLGEAEILGQVGDAFEESRERRHGRARARAALPHGGHGRPARALARPRSARTRRRRARWRWRSPRARSAISAAKRVLVVGAGRIGLQTLKAAGGRGVTRDRGREPDAGARGRGGGAVRRRGPTGSTSSGTLSRGPTSS